MMPDFPGLGKMLVLLGFLLIAIGIFFIFLNKIPFLGRLPGDIYISRKNLTFYFPLATSILFSLVISLILWLWPRR
jgi:hypothetical protein